MRMRVQTGLLAMLVLVACASAGAQVIQQVPVVQPGIQFQPATRGLSTLLTDTTGGFPVPGLGFDYVHQAAVNSNLGVRALIDPVTQQQVALARQIRRETPIGSGVVLPFSNVPQIIVVAPPPQVVVIQQQAPAPERVEPVQAVLRDEPLPPPTPPRELPEIVFVRLDGKLFFVVAYSIRDTELVYVTSEGVRRTIPLAQLDLDFTRRLNEERGTTLQLPT